MRAVAVVWRPAETIVLICKATYDLEPVTCPLSAEQDDPTEIDSTWDDDPARSLAHASDFVPVKERADVVLVGYAYAPGRKKVRSLTCRLCIGVIDKSIEVFPDRFFMHGGDLREGQAFERMPLRYERAAGGPDTWNPVGIPHDVGPSSRGMLPLPNLQPPGIHVDSKEVFIAPVGYGPIAPAWPSRQEKLSSAVRGFQHEQWHEAAPHEGVNAGFWSFAPWDQQIEELRPDEPIILENLHPDHARLSTRLPGVKPRAMVDGGAEIELRADTLWIDTDRLVCNVTWRGQLRYSPSAPPKIIVAMERPGETFSWEVACQNISEPTEQLPRVGPGDTKDLDAISTVVLPAAALRTNSEGDAVKTQLPAMRSGPVLPFAPTGDTAKSPAAPPQKPIGPAPPRPVGQVPPPVLPPPPPPVPRAPALGGGQSIGQALAKDKFAKAVSPPTQKEVPEARKSNPGIENAVKMGAAAASDAAAKVTAPKVERPAPEPAPPQPPSPTKADREEEIVRLLWLDEAAMKEVELPPPWKAIISDLELRLVRDPKWNETAIRTAKKTRLDVLELLTMVSPLDSDALRAAARAAIGRHGSYEPPLAMVAGELVLCFDETESLRSLIRIASPFVPGNKKLSEAVEGATRALEVPGSQVTGALFEVLSAQLKEAFEPSRRTLPVDYLEVASARALVEARAYRRREILGTRSIRSLLHFSETNPPVPVYVPETAGPMLPLRQSLAVRLIVHVDLQQDATETHPLALRPVAIAGVARRASV